MLHVVRFYCVIEGRFPSASKAPAVRQDCQISGHIVPISNPLACSHSLCCAGVCCCKIALISIQLRQLDHCVGFYSVKLDTGCKLSGLLQVLNRVSSIASALRDEAEPN